MMHSPYPVLRVLVSPLILILILGALFIPWSMCVRVAAYVWEFLQASFGFHLLRKQNGSHLRSLTPVVSYRGSFLCSYSCIPFSVFQKQIDKGFFAFSVLAVSPSISPHIPNYPKHSFVPIKSDLLSKSIHKKVKICFSLRSSEGEGGTGSCSRRPPAPTPDEMRPPQNLQISCTGSPHRPASHGTKVKVTIFTFVTFTFHFGDIHVFTGDMKVFFFHWQC